MKKGLLMCLLVLVGCQSNNNVNTLSAKEAYAMINEKDVIVMDVREQSEYDEGHLPNALLIPLDTINEDNDLLPSKESTILIYCRSGNRSHQAALKMLELGYSDIYDIGGINDWPYEIIK